MGNKQNSLSKELKKQRTAGKIVDTNRKIGFGFVEAVNSIVTKILFGKTSLHDIMLLQDKKYCEFLLFGKRKQK